MVSVTLSGASLKLQDIAKLETAEVSIEPSALDKLEAKPDLSKAEAEAVLNPNFTRASLLVALNSLLRKGKPVRSSLVTSLLSSIISSSPIATDWSPLEFSLFNQSKHILAVHYAQGLFKLKSSLEILEAGIALEFEAKSLDSSVVSESNFSGLSQGTKLTLGNIEGMLQDSKLAKKNPTSLDDIFDIGYLRDLTQTATQLVERELNHDMVFLQKQSISRSNRCLISSSSTLTELVSAILTRTSIRLTGSPEEFSSTDLLELATALHKMAFDLIQLHFSALRSLEASINEKAGKPRALQLGRGSKTLFEFCTATPDLTGLDVLLTQLFQAKNEERRIPKLAKGMRDYGPEQMAIREVVFRKITQVFKKHMAGELDTPVMELRETLTGKYGEEGGKLIYDLADQGGELLSLRYDLTVPFARHIAMNRINNWKRYQIAKVYRRDQPQMQRGRYREFYQCDFDIVGAGAPMLQDAEVLKIVVEILTSLEIPFVLKVNHRKVLDAVLEIAGVPPAKFRTTSSSIDKLDKEPWETVRTELVSDKGLAPEVADAIGRWVVINGNFEEVLAHLRSDGQFAAHESGSKAAGEMQMLAEFCDSLGIVPNINFDLSLARGLDYYTGLVYEATLADSTIGVGSIAGGGRYDELIGRLGNAKNAVPAVGVSFGVERLFSILENKHQASKMIFPNPSVLVIQAGTSKKFDLMKERLKICNLLWDNQFPAETSYKTKSDPKGQAGYAAEFGIPFTIWIGEAEAENARVRVKNMSTTEEQDVPIDELIAYMHSLTNS